MVQGCSADAQGCTDRTTIRNTCAVIDVKIEAVFQAASDNTIGRMVFVEVGLAGRPLRALVDGFEITLQYPELNSPIPGQGYVARMNEDEASAFTAAAPQTFKAHTVVQIPGPADDEASQSKLRAAVRAIRTAATRLSDAARLSQPSSGLVGESPKMIARTATDLATGAVIPIAESLNPGYPIVRYPPLTVHEAETSLLHGPSITRSLLAQARHLTLSSRDPQPGLAVLLAAVACEAEAKRVLLAEAKGEALPLIEVFLRRPRIFQEPAVELFGEVAMAVLGRSLKEEDRELWKLVVQLFETRNRMAHVADRPENEVAVKLVVAADRAIEWLSRPRTPEHDSSSL